MKADFEPETRPGSAVMVEEKSTDVHVFPTESSRVEGTVFCRVREFI